MKKGYSTFKITLLLYTIVVMIGVNAFFVHQLDQWVQEDSFAIKQIRLVSELMQELELNVQLAAKGEKIDEIDKRFLFINDHFLQQQENQLLAGFFNPHEEFASLMSCWQGVKKEIYAHPTEFSVVIPGMKNCRKKVKILIKIVEKMISEKHSRMLNTLYFGLLLSILTAIIVIYYVNIYIRKQLIKHTVYDSLTKLYNRSYFLAEIKNTTALANRHTRSLSLICVNLDNFREISKEEGPEKSDAILSVFGELMLSLIRSSDMACRFSEDEFTIIAPDSDLKSALIVAERLRKKVLNHAFDVEHPMTASISVTQCNADETPEHFVQRALDTMYEAKKERNKVLISDA